MSRCTNETLIADIHHEYRTELEADTRPIQGDTIVLVYRSVIDLCQPYHLVIARRGFHYFLLPASPSLRIII